MLMNVRSRPNQLKPCTAPDLGANGLLRMDRFRKARVCRQLGRTEEAIEALRKLIELAPDHGLAWHIPEARALMRRLGRGRIAACATLRC